jgi:hypothetical protein
MSELVRLAKEALRQQQALDPITTIQPGDRITWQGSDGKVNDGVIDFLHACPGETWAFCTLPDGRWCAVNTNCLRGRESGAAP